MIVAKFLLLKSSCRCERWRRFTAPLELSRAAAKLDDDRLAGNGLEVLTQAYYARRDAVCRSEVYQEHVVLVVMDDPVQQRDELRLALHAEAALEDGVLKPRAEPAHYVEHAPPAFGIAYVIGDDVKMLVIHRVVKFG